MRSLLPALFILGLVPLSAQDAGMLPRWEVADIATGVEQHAQGVMQILDQVRPKEWLQDGAPQAYVDQYENLQHDLTNLELSAQALGRDPEKLTVVVDTYLWLDRVSSMLTSMTTGVRRYQSSAVADLLDSASGKNAGSIELLKEYMRQLAVVSEDQLAIAHEEAQRCRAEVVAQPQ